MNDNMGNSFEIMGRFRSLCCAIRGIRVFIVGQQNAWIHAITTTVVVLLGSLFQLSGNDWCWIVMAITLVWTMEAMNTALELLADVACPEIHPLIRDAKDVAAGAVLITAIGAACIGLIVFWPHIFKIFVA